MARLQAERQRLADADRGVARWRRWGPYLAERAWGTVREDYGAEGDPWSYFPHEHARSRAYRWNEDGLAGFCDEAQTLCLAVALWNERDPILKERMFGLSNRQGNHGEDAKEYWFFLDGTPTHSYMKMRYLYPQVAYPYDELVRANAARDASLPEVELLDVLRDAFAERRYFDVLVEYAKAGPEDLLCRIRAVNRGPDPAPIHVLPHLWYRNTWAWKVGAEAPVIEAAGQGAARTRHPAIGERFWYVRAPDGRDVELLFTGNETNLERLYGVPNAVPQVKDGIHDRVVGGKVNAVNAERGSKAAAHISATVAPGATFEVQVRLAELEQRSPFTGFDATFDRRIAEADDFYAGIHPEGLTAEERRVQRLAFAGLLWSKQYYAYDVYRWLEGDPTQPPPPDVRWKGRNHRWKELSNADVLLMPDTWEYPWYAAWDLAFHCVTMAHVDPRTAKDQLLLLGRERYQHASGQYPAYEWNLDDVNPPLEGWAALQVYRIEAQATGRGDVAFLREAFQSAMLSFGFWVNRRDAAGRDVFGGGFLGMDNIGVFDRDRPVPGGGELEQSDGTGWMARFAMTMLE
ncbi:MAG TPA: glucosidase, partial [Anaeromyxobacteraceae bacterium]|nr:glucosidase [Anaeromyxobacteraceae bacterium]